MPPKMQKLSDFTFRRNFRDLNVGGGMSYMRPSAAKGLIRSYFSDIGYKAQIKDVKQLGSKQGNNSWGGINDS